MIFDSSQDDNESNPIFPNPSNLIPPLSPYLSFSPYLCVLWLSCVDHHNTWYSWHDSSKVAKKSSKEWNNLKKCREKN